MSYNEYENWDTWNMVQWFRIDGELDDAAIRLADTATDLEDLDDLLASYVDDILRNLVAGHYGPRKILLRSFNHVHWEAVAEEYWDRDDD